MERVICELCHSSGAVELFRQRDLSHRITDEEFTVVRCKGCGLLYLNPRPTEGEIGRYYPAQYYGPPSPPRRFSRVKRWIMEDYYGYPAAAPIGPWQSIRKVLLWPDHVRRILTGRVILPWIGEGRLLDVGCGAGHGTIILMEQGWDVQGLDVSEVAVAHARHLLGDRVKVGDVRTVRFADRSFDILLVSHALEHMYGLFEVLGEIRRILDDGGLLVVTVPNVRSWEARIFGSWWFPWELPRHLYHFDRDTLTRLLERAGFRVIRSQTGVTPAHFMTSLERIWTNRFGRRLPVRRWLEKFFVKPLCLAAGNLGYGTEITVHAVKKE